MKIKSLSRDAAAGALSWLLTGTVVLLVMLFSAMIVRDYGRETTAARQTIEEKGSVLIRALESGTRVGMGMRMHHAQLQALLEEMAWQPGVLWFAVTDENGKIIAHSDPQQVGKTLYSPAQMRALAVGEQARWRRLSEPQPALEIYRHFRPLNPARGHHMGMMNRGNSALAQAIVPQVIFIAFDSRELDAAQARGQRNMAIMLGAAALGDIGKHFPDTDEAYRGISSMLLLRHVVALLKAHHARVTNCDVTIVAQKPKLLPYIPQMRQNVADALELPLARVNIKATTTEKLGFEGEEKGISAQAVCMVQENG